VLVEVRVFILHSYSSLYVYTEALPPQSLGCRRALHVPRVTFDEHNRSRRSRSRSSFTIVTARSMFTSSLRGLGILDVVVPCMSPVSLLIEHDRARQGLGLHSPQLHLALRLYQGFPASVSWTW
jgi:hypothetical protein